MPRCTGHSPHLTLGFVIAGFQQRSNSGARKLSNQQQADEPDYGVPVFYADDQAGLDGSCDLEVERCELG